jgi:hypothetical protein
MGDNGARVVAGPQRTETGWSRELRWTVEADMPWSKLVDALRGSKPAWLDRCDFGDRTVTCEELQPGDTVTLNMTLEFSGHPTRAAVRLTGRAD